FTRGAHLRSQRGIDAGEFVEGEDRGFHEALRHWQAAGILAGGEMTKVAEFFSCHQADGYLRERHTCRFRDERDRARGAGIHFQHVDYAVFDRVLYVHQADYPQRFREPHGVVFDCRQLLATDRVGGQDTGAVAGMHARFFDMLHHTGDQHVVFVGEGVYVDLGRVFQEAVDQDRAVLREAHGFLHVLADRIFVVGDDHRATASHIPWPPDP